MVIEPSNMDMKATFAVVNYTAVISLAPHTSGPRDVPRCGALSLLQKDADLQGGVQQKTLLG